MKSAIKYADDTVIFGLINNGDEQDYKLQVKEATGMVCSA